MLRSTCFLLLCTVVFSVFLDTRPSKYDTWSSEDPGYYHKSKSHRNRPSYDHDYYSNNDYNPQPRPHPHYYSNNDHNPKPPHRPPPRPHPPPKPRPTPRPRRGCEPGWHRTQRASGGWCMKVFAGTLDQPSSEKLCRAKGAVLSGLRTITEINYVVAAAMTVIAPEPSGGVWIGVKRRPECIGQVLTPTCNSTHSFYWTDHSAEGYEGMKFQAGEPNNGNSPPGPGRNQNCALLTVSYSPTVHAVSTYYTGQMDDIACDVSGASQWPTGTLPRRNRAYVCGKSAPHYG